MKTLKEIKESKDNKTNNSHTRLDERLRKMNKKQKNSSKVVRETTEQLFGKEGTARPLADKIFKIFKREVRKKSKELGVPISQVRTWKITLRDTDNPKVNTNINGKKNR